MYGDVFSLRERWNRRAFFYDVGGEKTFGGSYDVRVGGKYSPNNPACHSGHKSRSRGCPKTMNGFLTVLLRVTFIVVVSYMIAKKRVGRGWRESQFGRGENEKVIGSHARIEEESVE